MATTVDVEDLHTTKSEKLLAFVMLVFLLIGGVWAYQEIDDRVRSAIEERAAAPADEAALRRRDEARQRVADAGQAQREARREVGFRREEFRAAVDAGRPAGALETRYRAAQAAYARAQEERRRAGAALAATQEPAAAAGRRIAAEIERRREQRELVTFLLRLALVLVSLALAFVALARLRARNSRYLPLAGAALAYTTILAFALAGDYLTDYFNPLDAGLLVLSLIGAAATTSSFWLLQRYLARRLPHRRVRRGECPYCAYPVRGNERCEGCGRQVIAACAHCEQPRRVGTRYCAACGQT